MPASSAPDLLGDPSRVDPEEAFVASISSCHMLWFLALAAKAGLGVKPKPPVVVQVGNTSSVTFDRRVHRPRRWHHGPRPHRGHMDHRCGTQSRHQLVKPCTRRGGNQGPSPSRSPTLFHRQLRTQRDHDQRDLRTATSATLASCMSMGLSARSLTLNASSTAWPTGATGTPFRKW